ncbi:hypothetical protein [Niabella aquatica]
MKKLTIMIVVTMLYATTVQAQILKKLQEKVEKTVSKTVEQTTDKAVDKVIKKPMDKAADKILEGTPAKKTKEKAEQTGNDTEAQDDGKATDTRTNNSTTDSQDKYGPLTTDNRGWYQGKSIEYADIGWIKMLDFKDPPKPIILNGRNYPVSQMEVSQKLATWIQQTYSPRGLLGEMVQSVYALPAGQPVTSTSYNYNEAEKNNRNALPNTYGATGKMYSNLQKTSTKKFWPIDGLAGYYVWQIMANNIELISRQMIGLSSPDEYYCTMPQYSMGMKGEYEGSDKNANYQNFMTSSNLKNYTHYWIPSDALNNNEHFYVVVMTKDKQPLPFEQITVAELLTRLEKQLPLMEKIDRNSGGRLDNMLQKAKNGLNIMKKKFKDNYSDYVYLKAGHDIQIIDLANLDEKSNFYWIQTKSQTTDSYGNTNVYFPILRLKKGVKEACANSGPQWIVFKMYKGKFTDHAGAEHMMANFVNRFNYDYVYDYFFGKGKVIKPYQPK